MMPVIEIVPAAEAHAAYVAAHMMGADAMEQTRFGIDPGLALRRSLLDSLWARTALVDGAPAAMWGISGALLGDIGVPWLLLAEDVMRVSPLRIMRIYRQEVDEMTRAFPVLRNWVDASHPKAVKALEVAGFKVGAPEPRGSHGAMFRPFQMGA